MQEVFRLAKLFEHLVNPELAGQPSGQLSLSHPQLEAVLDAGLAYYFAPSRDRAALPTLPTAQLAPQPEGLDITFSDFPHGKSASAFTLSLHHNPRSRLGIDIAASDQAPTPVKAGLALIPALLALSPQRGAITCRPNSLALTGPVLTRTPLLQPDQLAELTSSKSTILPFAQLAHIFTSIMADLPKPARTKLDAVHFEVVPPKLENDPLSLVFLRASGIFSLLTLSLSNDVQSPDGLTTHSQLFVNPSVRFAQNPHRDEVVRRITRLFDLLTVPLARQLLATSASLDTPPTLHLTSQGIALTLDS